MAVRRLCRKPARWLAIFNLELCFFLLCPTSPLAIFALLAFLGRGKGTCQLCRPLGEGGFSATYATTLLVFLEHGREVGFYFGMGCFAKRLRSECLRKDLELEKGEVSRKDRLEALVREILQEEMVEVDEKDTEKFEFHRMAVDVIVKRIRC